MHRTKWKIEPMLLLVIAIPLATVIAGIFTIVLAVQHRDIQATPTTTGMTTSVPTTLHGVPIR